VSGTSDVGLSVVRKAIEERADEAFASSVIFQALSELPEGEDIPKSLSALTIFVAGPLAKALKKRLTAEESEPMIEAVKDALASAAIGMPKAAPVPKDLDVGGSDSDWPEVVIEEGPGASSAEGEEQKRPTLVMAGEESVGDTVRVMVLSGSPRLAQQIRAAFGGHRVTVSFSSRYDETAERLESFSPAIVIIDGQNEPEIPPSEVGTLLTGRAEALVLVWASDQLWGSAAVRKLEDAGATFAPIPKSTGVESMLDYVRARFV
jgi:hypothetical protein